MSKHSSAGFNNKICILCASCLGLIVAQEYFDEEMRRFRLAHEVIKHGASPAEDTIVFFHGMLGRRMNLRSFARKYVTENYY